MAEQETYLAKRRRWLQEDVLQMNLTAQRWQNRRAELARQHAELDITDNELAVFTKRERAAAAKALYEASLKVAARVKDVMADTDARVADKYAADYWHPDKIDTRSVEIHQELLQRRLSRVGEARIAEEMIEAALTSGDKNRVYAAWRLAPVVAKHPDQGVRMLSGRMENALARHLARDPEYLAAVEKQNQVIDAAAAGIVALKQHAAGELGGADSSAAVWGARSPVDTVSYVLDLFEADGAGRVGYWDPAAFQSVEPAGPDGQMVAAQGHSKATVPPTLQLNKHIVREYEETGGPF